METSHRPQIPKFVSKKQHQSSSAIRLVERRAVNKLYIPTMHSKFERQSATNECVSISDNFQLGQNS